MSLLMSEEFSVYQLRLGYLNNIHDGVGERLINLNPAVLNNPAFRKAGWTPDVAAIKRCYSPPIPTGTSDISNEYFQRPRRLTGKREEKDDEIERGGMVTGHQGSEDTLGPSELHVNERKRERRRRQEQLEDDDSSDLSDDSDEDERGPAQSIKFSRMPLRSRASTSPATPASTIRASHDKDGPEVVVTSPSRPPEQTLARMRSGSLGAVELVRQRKRRDTTTSSELSSENELAPTAVFKKKIPSRPGKGPSMLMLEDDIEEEDEDQDPANSDIEDEDDDIGVGEASDLSDEFEGLSESPRLLGVRAAEDRDGMSSSPIPHVPIFTPAITPASSSPRKSAKDGLPKLPKLPLGHRVQSSAQPVSMISKMFKPGKASNEKTFQRYAQHSGKGEASPLWIKIYAPFSEKPTTPFEVPLRRIKDDRPVTVAELVGLALWRYEEEGYKPALTPEEGNINRWTLRIVEDEEVDFDFPALGRTRPVVDFTSNNNRPPQRRARDRPWDEFALVKATDQQFKQNEELTPQLVELESVTPLGAPTPRMEQDNQLLPSLSRTISEAPMSTGPTLAATFRPPAHNPITGPSFAPSALRKDSTLVQDVPQREARQGAPRVGAPRTVIVYYTDPQSFSTRTERFETTADSYIAEIFDQSCKRINIDKALHVLKVHGTQTVAPSDRTVEALGDRLHLDLVRRRFLGGNIPGGDGMFGLGLSGSPGSSSPNAPLELVPANATPTQGRKKGMKGFTLHPLAAQQKSELNATTASMLNLAGVGGIGVDGKRYNVLRKQPLSFAAPHPRTLIITPEYMTIMPNAPDSFTAPIGKVTNVPMTSIIGAKVSRKHPKMIRILVFREKETKRYDFEAVNHREAEEVVVDVRRGMAAFGYSIDSG